MNDIVTREKRSEMMRSIRSEDTKPEMIVRRFLHARGFRYRLHSSKLPGRPDIVLPKYRTVIFVHGCFWHHHKGCRYAYTPKSRTEFWKKKFVTNRQRDLDVQNALIKSGWRVIVIWECVIRDDRHRQDALEKLQKAIVNPNLDCLSIPHSPA